MEYKILFQYSKRHLEKRENLFSIIIPCYKLILHHWQQYLSMWRFVFLITREYRGCAFLEIFVNTIHIVKLQYLIVISFLLQAFTVILSLSLSFQKVCIRTVLSFACQMKVRDLHIFISYFLLSHMHIFFQSIVTTMS